MADIFISYKSEDREAAVRLATELENLGFSVWWDRKIPAGRTYDEVIEEAIREARCVVVLWSEESVTSDWVKTEAAEGANRSILVPALIEEVSPPLEFRRIQAADLSGWTGDAGDPAFESFVAAVSGKIAQSGGQPAETPGDDELASSSPATSTPQLPMWYRSRQALFIAGGLVVAIIAAIAFVILTSGSGDDDVTALSREEAVGRLDELLSDVPWTAQWATRRPALDPLVPTLRLPPINQFPMVVTAGGESDAVTVEIFVSTEKSGAGSDGWIVTVAEAFNDAGLHLQSGERAKVEVRSIASGIGYEYIASGAYSPDAYSPSNHLWIEMARARGATMTPVSESLVKNIAGLVLRTDTAERLRDQYGALDASTLIRAVSDGALPMAYTDPFASSTGLNFLTALLWELGDGDLNAPGVQRQLEQFQVNVPFVALTTLQIRDSVVAGGQLEAFVMEYQTFANTDVLSNGFEFVPFGIRHDNPLYAVGDVDDAELEVLTLFANFADGPEYRAIAEEFGFDPPAYTPPLATPAGQELIDAQQLWKQEKDGGDTVTAVFVTDVSGSMAGSRMTAVQSALISGMPFITERNFVGLVVFDSTVTHVLPVQQFDVDHKRLFKGAVEDMRPGGGTAMYDGIAVGLKLLLDEVEERQSARPILIVLTDGETVAGHGFDDLQSVIANLDIPIYTIGFEADIDELRRVSGLVEAATINAGESDVEFQIARLFNAQL